MGMSLSTTAGYGILLDVDDDTNYTLYEKLEELASEIEGLSFAVGHFGDYYLNAAVFVADTVKKERRDLAVLIDHSDLYITSSQKELLEKAAEKLGIEFKPNFVVIVSYF